jgi:hypothetical protein
MAEARPRAEACQRVAVGELRRLAAPGAQSLTLPDGQALALQWRPVVGCYGGRGQALLIGCPVCGAWGRVLWRPPGQGWGCWRCRPVSHRSHRRPGGRNRKPASWHAARIRAAQTRTAALLGVAWPPPGLPVSWGLGDLLRVTCRPGGPRLSIERRGALLERLSALETLRLSVVLPAVCADLRALGAEPPSLGRLGVVAELARETVKATAWAVRRPGAGGNHRGPQRRPVRDPSGRRRVPCRAPDER